MIMMGYCPPNVSLSEVWINHGISQCFMETFTSAFVGAFLISFGIMQIFMYKRFASEASDVRPSKLLTMQLFFTLFLPLLAVIRFFLQAFVYKAEHIYGYMILVLLVNLIVFPLSFYLIKIERWHTLPAEPLKGHGFVLLVFWGMIFVAENLSFINYNKEEWWWKKKDLQDSLEMALFIGRYISCMMLFILGIKSPGITQPFESLDDDEDDESDASSVSSEDDENRSTFRNGFKNLRKLLPYVVPKNDIWLQLSAFICIITLIAGRVVNVYVPIYNKLIVNSLTAQPLEFRWDLVLIYIAVKFLQGGSSGGLLSNIRSLLWIKVQQYTARILQLKLFKHLHDLPLKWHLSRKTGEVIRVMDRGVESIDELIYDLVFYVGPTIIDLTVAIVYFVVAFNVWFGLIVFITMTLYMVATIAITEWRTKFQRRTNTAENKQKARSVDSLLNYETVKYYGAEGYEVSAYKDAIVKYQKEEYKSSLIVTILNVIQNIIICTGLLVGSLLIMHMVVRTHELTEGDYVLFASYIIQLYVPLGWFGMYYREIQKEFVDMENMFDMLDVECDVKDAEGATELVLDQGSVEFKNVSFSYVPERQVLNNVSFKVPSGSTLALVGPSGAGKSTIMRLLFRFYDVNDGTVLVDGQDVRNVTQASLRANIGIVPQDTVLFNNTIKYNIQYGRLEASSDEVIAAAKNADIHDRILTFPDGYNTKVGERGLRLSGGEKQRIAIARTLLKNPAIVLLDEATSALDTNTERNIQAALSRVCTNRTTLIIAHRLSTIIHADEILVLKDGEIIEKGNHENLLSQGGVYASMWQQQLENKNGNNKETNEEDCVEREENQSNVNNKSRHDGGSES